MAQIKKKVRILEKQTPKKSKWWLWLLLVAVVAIVVIFCVKNCSSNGDENTKTEPAGITVEQSATTPAGETQNMEADGATIKTDGVAVSEKTTTPATAEETTVPQAETTPIVQPASTPVSTPVKSSNQPATNPVTNKKSISGSVEEKVKQVIRGDFGNGAERKNNLGSEYDAIQSKVNEMYRSGEVY